MSDYAQSPATLDEQVQNIQQERESEQQAEVQQPVYASDMTGPTGVTDTVVQVAPDSLNTSTMDMDATMTGSAAVAVSNAATNAAQTVTNAAQSVTNTASGATSGAYDFLSNAVSSVIPTTEESNSTSSTTSNTSDIPVATTTTTTYNSL